MLNNSCRLILLLFFFSLPGDILAAVFVNEIMYDMPGSDLGREWIEIHNSGSKPVDLSGWNIETTANHRPFVLISGSFILPPLGFAVIVGDYESFKKDQPDFNGTVFESNFSLNNTFGRVILKNGEEKIDEVNYISALGAEGDGNSLQRFGDNWRAYLPTPGEVNKVTLPEIQKEAPLILLENKESQVEFREVYKEASTLSEEKPEEEDIKEEKVFSVSVDKSLNNGSSEEDVSMFKWFLILLGLFVVASLPIIFSSRSGLSEDINIEDIKIVEE